MLDWLIIGGGIHGTHLAHMLVNQYGCSADAVWILDPYDRLLQILPEHDLPPVVGKKLIIVIDFFSSKSILSRLNK